MIFYIKCPSCSRGTSVNLDKLYDDYDDISNNPKLSKKEQDELVAGLLDKYNFKKYCCRARILGMLPVPYHKIINT